MTDLHTHILPGMDDGASDVATALEMLRIQKMQGVDTVALTPHFYRGNELPREFLKRRNTSWESLRTELPGKDVPNVILGAEVAWAAGMVEWPELEDLCYEGTKTLLVELPVTPWSDELFRQLYGLSIRRGITPMIAHLDRYFGKQSQYKMEHLLEMGFPVQISSKALFKLRYRRRTLSLLNDFGLILISDCHNTGVRPPNMGDAMSLIERKLGVCAARMIASATDDAIFDDPEI